MTDKSWRAEMRESLADYHDPDTAMRALVTRANAELDAAAEREASLRRLTELQSVRLLQLVAECQRLAKEAGIKDYHAPPLDGTLAERERAKDARIAELERENEELFSEGEFKLLGRVSELCQLLSDAEHERDEALARAGDPFRPLAGEVPDCILTYEEIQEANSGGNLRVAPASGIGTEYECGPGFVTVEYANQVLARRSERAEARIRELTEWRPMSEAPKEFIGSLRGEVVICYWLLSSLDHHEPSYEVKSGRRAGEIVFASELDGWFPLPEVKP